MSSNGQRQNEPLPWNTITPIVTSLLSFAPLAPRFARTFQFSTVHIESSGYYLFSLLLSSRHFGCPFFLWEYTPGHKHCRFRLLVWRDRWGILKIAFEKSSQLAGFRKRQWHAPQSSSTLTSKPSVAQGFKSDVPAVSSASWSAKDTVTTSLGRSCRDLALKGMGDKGGVIVDVGEVTSRRSPLDNGFRTVSEVSNRDPMGICMSDAASWLTIRYANILKSLGQPCLYWRSPILQAMLHLQQMLLMWLVPGHCFPVHFLLLSQLLSQATEKE